MPVAVKDTSAADPAAFAESVRATVEAGAPIHLQVGDSSCDVSGQLAEGVIALLALVGSGASVDLTALPPELTTGQAADILGVSRPTVVDLIEKGVLEATRVGTHRLIQTVDLLAYRERARRERRKAVDEVAEIGAELGLYGE